MGPFSQNRALFCCVDKWHNNRAAAFQFWQSRSYSELGLSSTWKCIASNSSWFLIIRGEVKLGLVSVGEKLVASVYKPFRSFGAIFLCVQKGRKLKMKALPVQHTRRWLVNSFFPTKNSCLESKKWWNLQINIRRQLFCRLGNISTISFVPMWLLGIYWFSMMILNLKIIIFKWNLSFFFLDIPSR